MHNVQMCVISTVEQNHLLHLTTDQSGKTYCVNSISIHDYTTRWKGTFTFLENVDQSAETLCDKWGSRSVD